MYLPSSITVRKGALISRVAACAALICSGASINGTLHKITSAGPTLVPALAFALMACTAIP